MSVLKQTAWKTSRFIAQNGGVASRALYELAHLYKRSYNNLNYDMKTNGEYYILDKISNMGINTVFDVGANKGAYTRACLSRFVDASIHAFEIAAPTHQKLAERISSDRVKLNNFGLSNFDGSIALNYNADADELASLIEGRRIHDGVWREIEARVLRGDSYCENEGLSSIDLLKVDVEGAEHLVFDGFTKLFESGKISAVQFEFGMVNIYSKFLMNDFYELFRRYDFVLGPVMPRGVKFKEYDPRDEDFHGPPNFFAVHKSKPRIIEAIGL